MAIHIGRRDFITLLGGTAVAWPLMARAQQGDRMRRIGVLSGFPADDPEMVARMAAFRQAMQEQGWGEGRNLQIDYRSAGADAARIKSHAAELVGAPPDVILAITSPSVAAVRQATNTIPIVFVGIGDPVGQGFVASLARPGGNITGFTGLEFSLGDKVAWFSQGVGARRHTGRVSVPPRTRAVSFTLAKVGRSRGCYFRRRNDCGPGSRSRRR